MGRSKAIRLWLDDRRPKPFGFHVRCRTAEEAKAWLLTSRITHISFDHDLGPGSTGYDVAKWIEEQAHCGKLKALTWEIHSANPVGRRNIEWAMQSAKRAWDR